MKEVIFPAFRAILSIVHAQKISLGEGICGKMTKSTLWNWELGLKDSVKTANSVTLHMIISYGLWRWALRIWLVLPYGQFCK